MNELSKCRMSSLESKDQTTEEIETNPTNKSENVTEQCGTPRTSKLATRIRSLSISGRKSKIPTNIGHTIRSGSTVQPHPQPTVSSDDGTIGKASSTNSEGLPASKSLTVASSPSVVAKTIKSSSNSTGNSTMHNRYLETQFSTKKKRYVNLRKELTEKQKNATELYIEMSQIREKLIAKGGRDPGKVEAINFPSVGIENLTTSGASEGHHVDGSGEHTSGPNVSVTNEFLQTAISKIRELPKRFFDLCSDMLRQRSEIMQSLVKIENSKDKVEIEVAVAKEVEYWKNETSTLDSQLEEAQKLNEASISEIIEKLSTLWNELESSNEKILQLENNNSGFHKEICLKLDTAMNDKKLAEMECARLKEREVSLESENQKLRTKVRDTETRISEGDQKIARLQNHIKNLETQLKQKDSNADKQLKDLEKSLKSSQSLLSKTEKQRECLESKLVELKKHLGFKEKENENKIKQISNKLAAANLELAKQHGERGDVTTDKNGSSGRTDRRLAECDEKIKTLQRQKQEIIRAVDPGFFGDKCDLESNDDDETHNEIIGLLKNSLEKLRLNSEKQQEKIENLQQQLEEFNSDGYTQLKCTDKPFTAHRIKDLEKQVNELRISHKELSRRNEQLELALNQKQLEIEKRDRIIKERSNVMKVRDEVIDLITENSKLRDKSLDSHSSLMKKGCHFREREQVDRQIAEKTENLQELYSTLESKQMQITRLEQLVEQMEIQQERAQEQRTRLEKKIAQLQLAIHCRKGHRYVSPETRKLSTSKVSSPPCREIVEKSRNQSLSGAETLSKFQTCPPVKPRPSSRRAQSRSPIRQPSIQRSKTLSSFNVKKRPSPSKIYAYQVMNEVARALKREREYDYKKRSMDTDDIAQGSREDRRLICPVDNVTDYLDITKDEIRESFYNWLVEPWMLGDTSPNVSPRSTNPYENYCMPDCSQDLTLSFRPKKRNRSSRRDKVTNDRNRETICDGAEYRKRSLPEWDFPPSPTRTQQTSQDTNPTHSRRQRP